MSTADKVRAHIATLVAEGEALIKAAQLPGDPPSFARRYQAWYTQTVRVVEQVAPDRLPEFEAYHGDGEYSYGSVPLSAWNMRHCLSAGVLNANSYNRLTIVLTNQIGILASLDTRIESFAADLRAQFVSDLSNAELATAEELKATSLRAAGAIAGVVLESHLQ